MGRFVETFTIASWLEHLRQHERTTKAELVLQEAVHDFHLGPAPKVMHWLVARPENMPRGWQ